MHRRVIQEQGMPDRGVTTVEKFLSPISLFREGGLTFCTHVRTPALYSMLIVVPKPSSTRLHGVWPQYTNATRLVLGLVGFSGARVRNFNGR